jgi:hypothetical protein
MSRGDDRGLAAGFASYPERREADFGSEIAPMLEAAHKFINFAEGGDYITENSSAASDDVIRAEARKLAETVLKLLDRDQRLCAAAAGE